jgi:hypothetical protein
LAYSSRDAVHVETETEAMRSPLAHALAVIGFAAVLLPAMTRGEDVTDPAAAAFADLQPTIVTRAQWKAKPALDGLVAHTPTSIVVHHTGVAQNPKLGLERKLQNLQSFSQSSATMGTRIKPPWPDIPYHFYIDMTGRIGETRDVRCRGDSNTSYDLNGHIQVVVEGDFEKETPARAQVDALADLLLWLSARWNVPLERITMHKDHAETDCPGQTLATQMPSILAAMDRRRTEAAARACAGDGTTSLGAKYCAPR